MRLTTSVILANPLITGANVSQTSAPLAQGKALALRHTNKTKIETIAFGGQTRTLNDP